MDAQNFAVDERRKREEIKDFRAVPPCIRVAILSLTLVVKPINLGNLPALVITS